MMDMMGGANGGWMLAGMWLMSGLWWILVIPGLVFMSGGWLEVAVTIKPPWMNPPSNY